MKLSILNVDRDPGLIEEVRSYDFTLWQDLKHSILEDTYCCATFFTDAKGVTRRRLENFEEASAVCLDIDSHLSIEEAKRRLKDLNLNHILSTSRNHQTEKRGRPPCDRFHILIFLNRAIRSLPEHKFVTAELCKIFPEADRAALDAAHMFFPSISIVSEYFDGLNFDFSPPGETHVEVTKLLADKSGKFGLLRPETLEFIESGAERGSWHNKLYQSACDLKEQGYSDSDIYKLCTWATRNFDGQLDQNDLRTIGSVLSKPAMRYRKKTMQIREEFQLDFSDMVSAKQLDEVVKHDDALRKKSFENQIHCLDPSLGLPFYLNQGLTFVGATSGSGKTQFCANVASQAVKNGKKTVIFSGETSAGEYYCRIASAMMGVDWCLGQDSQLRSSIQKDFDELKEAIKRVVKVVQHEELNDLRAVSGLFKQIPSEDFSLIIFDYYQTVTEGNSDNEYENCKAFGRFLKNYCVRTSIAVLLTGQIKEEHRYRDAFKDRIESDRSVFNHAAQVLELIREDDQVKVMFHKLRTQGHLLKLNKPYAFRFKDGKYVPS